MCKLQTAQSCLLTFTRHFLIHKSNIRLAGILKRDSPALLWFSLLVYEMQSSRAALQIIIPIFHANPSFKKRVFCRRFCFLALAFVNSLLMQLEMSCFFMRTTLRRRQHVVGWKNSFRSCKSSPLPHEFLLLYHFLHHQRHKQLPQFTRCNRIAFPVQVRSCEDFFEIIYYQLRLELRIYFLPEIRLFSVLRIFTEPSSQM